MRYLLPIFYLILLIGCKPTQTLTSEADYQNKADILTVMRMQEIAWSDGDVDAFMQGYWESDSLTFIGSRGLTHGWQTTLENYKSAYPTPEIMGKLSFDILKLEAISPQAYFMIGKYTLVRKEDMPTGYFTLVWKNINGQWKIVSDHTSG